jgi:intein-encoded DNA endonuclease-like protein
MPMYRKVNKDFFKKWTPEMAYVLGFFAADGYITVNRRGGQFWSIQIIDKELLEQIQRVVGSEHKISRKVRLGNESIIYRMQIGSIEMCDDLRRLGMRERKTKSLVVPAVPNKYFSDFVRGYFDGDGNVWVGLLNKDRGKPRLTIMTAFTSCSAEFLKQLLNKLFLFGLQGGSIYHSKRNYSRLQFSKNDSLKLYDFMYNQEARSQSGLFLCRKRKVFERYLRLKMRP